MVIVCSINVVYTLPVGHAFSVVGQSKYVSRMLIADTTFSVERISKLAAQAHAACTAILLKCTHSNDVTIMTLSAGGFHGSLRRRLVL